MVLRESYTFKHYDHKDERKKGVLLKDIVPNLNENRKQNIFPDINIYTKDGKEVYANRSIIGSTFPSLEHLLQGPPTDKNTRLHWKQFGFEEIEEIMSFTCTGILNVTNASVYRIFLLSICLQAKEQIDWCIKFIVDRTDLAKMKYHLRLATITRVEKLQVELNAKMKKELPAYIESDFWCEITFGVIRSLLLSTEFNEEARFNAALKWLDTKEKWTKHFEEIISFVEWSNTSKTYFESLVSDKSKLILEKKFRDILITYVKQPREYAIVVGRDLVKKKMNRLLALNPVTQRTFQVGSTIYRDCAAILRINESLYSIGGGTYSKDGFSLATNSVEAYNLNTRSTRQLSSMSAKRSYPAAASLDDEIAVCGGWWIKSCEVYDIKKNRWADLPDMNQKRCRFSVVWLTEGQLIACGGTSDGKHCLSSVEMLQRPTKTSRKDESGTWRVLASMADERTGHAAIEFDGKVFVVGGSNSSANLVTSTEVFAPPKSNSTEMGQWTTIATMQRSFDVSALVKFAGKFLAFSNETEVQKLESTTNSAKEIKWTWSPMEPLTDVQNVWGAIEYMLPITPKL